MNWKAIITYKSDVTKNGSVVVGFNITDGKNQYEGVEISCRPEQIVETVKAKLLDLSTQNDVAEKITVGTEITLDGISKSIN